MHTVDSYVSRDQRNNFHDFAITLFYYIIGQIAPPSSNKYSLRASNPPRCPQILYKFYDLLAVATSETVNVRKRRQRTLTAKREDYFFFEDFQ